jgi:hypothetical protein
VFPGSPSGPNSTYSGEIRNYGVPLRVASRRYRIRKKIALLAVNTRPVRPSYTTNAWWNSKPTGNGSRPGTCNVIPFGLRFVATSATWSNQIYQQHLTNAQLGRRVYKFGWTGAPPTTGSNGSGALKINVVCQKPDLHRYGHGCKGSNGKTPALGFTGSAALGATMSIDVTDCLANAISLHVIGTTRYGAGIDLGLAGAPGCLLYESTDFVMPKVASATGPTYSSSPCRRTGP